MYSRGKGVPQDYGEAVRWYGKSAEQGSTKAEYNLSSMYRMAREFLKTMRRLNTGAVKLLSRETRGPRRVLDSCITEAKECHRIMRRRRVGTENLPNKVMGTLNTSWATCITTATGWRRTKAKPTACSTKLPSKATRT